MFNSNILIQGVLFLLSFLFRLTLISKGPYHLDCLTMAVNSQATAATLQLHGLHSHGFPLSAILGALSVGLGKIFGISDPVTAVNLLAVLMSSLCILVLYRFVQNGFDTPTAIFSSIAFSLSPIFLGNSVYGNTHPIALFFLLLASQRIIRYHANPSRTQALLCGLLLGLVGAARLQDLAAFLIPAGIFFLLRLNASSEKPNVSLKTKLFDFGLVLAMAAITVTLFYVPLIMNDQRFSSQPQTTKFLNFELFSRFVGLTPDYFPYSLVYLQANFSYLGLLLVGAGAMLLFQEQKKSAIILLGWFLFPLLIFSTLDIINPRFFIISLVPLYILIGYLIAKLYRYNRHFKIGATVAWLMLLIISFLRIYPILEFRHQHALLPEFYRWLGNKAEPPSRVIIADGIPFLKYYSQLIQLPRPLKVRHPYEKSELANFQRNINELLAQKIPLYITESGLYSHDPDEQFSSFMKKNYQLKLIGGEKAEDWHLGAIYLSTYYEYVYQITAK